MPPRSALLCLYVLLCLRAAMPLRCYAAAMPLLCRGYAGTGGGGEGREGGRGGGPVSGGGYLIIDKVTRYRSTNYIPLYYRNTKCIIHNTNNNTYNTQYDPQPPRIVLPCLQSTKQALVIAQHEACLQHICKT